MRAQPAASEAAMAAELQVPPHAHDDAALALGRPLEFRTEDDLSLITAFGPGIRDVEVADGRLRLRVAGPEAYLMCGNLDGTHPTAGIYPFGVAYQYVRAGGWYRNTFAVGAACALHVRLKQSLPESRWRLVTGPIPEWNELCPTPWALGQTTEPFLVRGTEWQTVTISFSDKVRDAQGRPAELRPFGSFRLEMLDAGNEVEISWIRISDGWQHVYARRVLDLPAEPVHARMQISVWDSEVYVNGNLVAEHAFPLPGMGLREIDLLPQLRPGRNLVAIHEMCLYGELNVTGGVVCADGTYVPLHSWQPMRQVEGAWKPDPQVRHYSQDSPYAPPWKTAHLTFRPEDRQRFMQLDYDDSDWGTLTAMATSGGAVVATPYTGLLYVELPPAERSPANAPNATPRRHPIFSEREPVRLAIRALRLGPVWPPYRLGYRLQDQQTGTVLEQGVLPLDSKGQSHFTRRQLSPGPYLLHLELEADGRPCDARPYEFLVVGPLEQPAVESDDPLAGMELRLVVDIDCTADPEGDQFVALQGWQGKGAPGSAPVVENASGRFRETGPDHGDCFSYRVRLQHPGRPHLLEVTYPDDRHRVSSFYYTEPRLLPDGTRVGVNRCSLAALSGWRRATRQMQTVRGIFWPTQPEGTVDVFTTRYSPDYPPAPAAAARIRIYELMGELPRLVVRDFPGQFKPLGVHTERGGYVLFPTYYAGRHHPGEAAFNHLHERPDFYADWYSACTNFTRHLRYHGHNFYIAGQHMYGGTNFPSRFNDNDNGSGGMAIHCQHDWGGILASVLGENGCGFVSSLEFVNNSVIIARGTPSPAQLAAGIPTLVAVSEQGRAFPYGSGIYLPSPLPSYAHPEVQELLLAEVDELISLYQEYPAWKGIHFLLNSLCGPSYGELGQDPLKMGYEDVAIERFERESGIKIPVGRKDPYRFKKRYLWIQEHPQVLDAWVRWRCEVLLEIFRKIRDRLRAARPDCMLYLNIAYPYGPREERMRMAGDREALRRYIMRWGWDPLAYAEEPGMVIYTMVGADAEKRRWMAGQAPQMPLERAMALEPAYLNLFAGDGRGGWDLHCIFTENWPLAQAGTWLWSANGAWVAYHWPPGEHFADYWTNALVRAHPALVVYNWHDSNLDNRLEPALRRFARAWRALPNGRYERMRGQGLDRNLIVQRCREHPEYYLAANPWPWHSEVVLWFAEGSAVLDLHLDRPVAAGAGWRLDLPPFGIQAFKASGGAQPLLASEVRIDEAAIRRLQADLEAEELLAQRLLAAGVEGASEFAGQVARLRGLWNEQNYAEVQETLSGGYEYHLLRQKLEP